MTGRQRQSRKNGPNGVLDFGIRVAGFLGIVKKYGFEFATRGCEAVNVDLFSLGIISEWLVVGGWW